LFARALNLERLESADLVRSLVQPTGAQELIRVFEAMASIDKHIDAREIAMIEEFARRWNVEPPPLKEGALRVRVDEYLGIAPPKEQAEELLDVLHLFEQADGHVSAEEELVLEELTGMITHYVDGTTGDRGMFEVVIVPQNDEQLGAVRSLLRGVGAKVARGGTVFSAGRFFSPRYAEAVCDKYIALGLFTRRVGA
jgi:tellurite resistance protein